MLEGAARVELVAHIGLFYSLAFILSHEKPADMNDPLNKQNIKDRFNGRNDPVAQKILERQKLQEEEDKRERAKVELLLLFYL